MTAQNADELIPTRQSLLSRLKNSEDHDSWQDFFDTYWKLIYSVAVKSGLTVAEALWKKKPVVASAVGGIPTQVIHKQTGLLAHSVEGRVPFLDHHVVEVIRFQPVNTD